jgi:hypothetical protein
VESLISIKKIVGYAKNALLLINLEEVIVHFVKNQFKQRKNHLNHMMLILQELKEVIN